MEKGELEHHHFTGLLSIWPRLFRYNIQNFKRMLRHIYGELNEARLRFQFSVDLAILA